MAERKDPTWFQTSSLRVIPNHLVSKKKPGFQISAVANSKKDSKSTSGSSGSSSGGFNATDFNVITFGNRPHRASSASYADTLLFLQDADNTTVNYDNDDIPLYNNSDDVPPSRSMYDLNDEVFMSLNKPSQHTESFINKDPKTFNNLFAKADDKSNTVADTDSKILKNPLLNSELAILVFGYPELMANQVIARFAEFGSILEDFEAARSSKNSSEGLLGMIQATGAFPSASQDTVVEHGPPPPIFSGKSWVKLTYDNPSSAIDALQESGSVFNGCLIGVVPYTRDAVEKLQRRKLTSVEDIGGGLPSLVHSESSKVDNGVIGDSNDMQASYIKRLDIKDGSELFLKANSTNGDPSKGSAKKSDEKLGVWGTISNYFFGFHDL